MEQDAQFTDEYSHSAPVGTASNDALEVDPREENQLNDSQQNLTMEGEIRDEGHWFEIIKHDPKEVYQVVKALAFRDYCTLQINNEGLRLVVDDQHNQQGNAYFKYEQFSDFTLRVSSCTVRVQALALREALNMFSNSTAILRMWFDGEGSPLVLYLEDEGIVVQVSIRPVQLQTITDYEFTNEAVCKVILNPQSMKEILQDLDLSAQTVAITFTPNYVSFYTMGELGKIKIQIPANSEQIQQLRCESDKICYQYRKDFIKRLNECIKLCNKISLRIDQRGILSVQLIIPQAEQTVFVEFYCVADDDNYYDNS